MITIDLTTKNNVYNTLGAQAQWVQHRFGKRNYPNIEICLDAVLKIIKSSNDSFNFMSVYGDPAEHSNIIEIIKNVEAGKCIFNTTLNFVNEDLISLLNEKHACVVVPIFGIEDLSNKILLECDWNKVIHNINSLSCNIQIEFYIYEHNFHQIEIVKKLFTKDNIKIEFKKGLSLHPAGFSAIVDSNGDWLYDVYSYNENNNIPWKSLEKTVNGYNSLIQYVKPIKGKSIFENPLVYKLPGKNKYDDSVSISVTGDVFPSLEMHQIFSNCLCTDWSFAYSKIIGLDKITINEEYKKLCLIVNDILTYLKQENNINKKDFLEILTNFTNSNI